MKILRTASLSLLGLLCLGMTRTAHAQWVISGGTITLDKSATLPRYSAGCNDTTCVGQVLYIGTMTVNYTTHLSWTGAGIPQTGAMVVSSGNVSGKTSNPNGAGTVTATSESSALNVDVKGASANGTTPYSAKPSDQATKGPLFAQNLTATLYLQCTCDPYNSLAYGNEADAQLTFSL